MTKYIIDYFRNYSSNAHQVCCVDNPTKHLYDHCESDDRDLRSRSQVRLKRDYFLTCNISDNISAVTFKLGMTVDLHMTCSCSFFDARSQWVGKGTHSVLNYFDN